MMAGRRQQEQTCAVAECAVTVSLWRRLTMKTKHNKSFLQIVLGKQKGMPGGVGLQDDKEARHGGKKQRK